MADPTPLSDLQERKLQRAFVHLDVDGDGRIEREDVLALAARMLVGFGEATTSGKGKRVVETLEALWDVLLDTLDLGPDGRLGEADLPTAVAAAFVHGHRRDEALVPAALAMAWLCDTDDDGFVVEHDLRTLHEAFDLAPSAATLAMGHLDPAGSGRVGVDDLARAVCEYYVGDDPAAPGTWLFGTVDLLAVAPGPDGGASERSEPGASEP
jgi:Ca2+-binding EF-hand superfamily protein